MLNRLNVLVTLAVLTMTAGFCLAEDSEGVRWIKQYGAARRVGSEESKPVLLFVTSEECVYCDRMKQDVFADQQVIDRVSRDFVPAMVKIDHESKLGKALKITIFPTTMVIAPDGKIVEYARGYLSKSEFQSRLLIENRLAQAGSSN